MERVKILQLIEGEEDKFGRKSLSRIEFTNGEITWWVNVTEEGLVLAKIEDKLERFCEQLDKQPFVHKLREMLEEYKDAIKEKYEKDMEE